MGKAGHPATPCGPGAEHLTGDQRDLLNRFRTNLDGITAAVEFGLSNSRLRPIQYRGYDYHSVESLADVIHLCLGGITPQLPTRMSVVAHMLV